MSEEPKSIKESFKKGYAEGILNPRVAAAIGMILVLSAALIIEMAFQAGQEFLDIITLWIALLIGARYGIRFPKDK